MTGLDRVLIEAARQAFLLGKALLAPQHLRALCFPRFSLAKIEIREKQTVTGTAWPAVGIQAVEGPRVRRVISE